MLLFITPASVATSHLPQQAPDPADALHVDRHGFCLQRARKIRLQEPIVWDPQAAATDAQVMITMTISCGCGDGDDGNDGDSQIMVVMLMMVIVIVIVNVVVMMMRRKTETERNKHNKKPVNIMITSSNNTARRKKGVSDKLGAHASTPTLNNPHPVSTRHLLRCGELSKSA